MPRQKAEPTDELSIDEFVAGLTPSKPRQPRVAPKSLRKRPAAPAPESSDLPEMSIEEFAAGIGDVFPKKPTALQSFAGQGLEMLSTVPGLGRIATQKVGKALGISEEAPLFSAMEGGLRGLAQEVYPQEVRGRGGLMEDVAGGAGSIVGALPAMALGPAAAALQFGAAEAVPMYHTIKEKTGDESAATLGLLFGFGVGQLERFGAEKAAMGLAKRLIGKPGVLKALEQSVLIHALGVQGAEVGTGLVQQGLLDAMQEHLTGEDIDNIENLKRVLPVEMILGGGFGTLSAVAEHRARKAATAPGMPQETGTPEVTQGPTQAPTAPTAPPIESGGMQPAVPSDVAPQAPAPVRTVADIGPETAPGGPAVEAQPQLHQLSLDELTSLEDERRKQIKADEERVGVAEISKRMDRLTRRAENPLLSRAEQDKAQAELDALEQSLTPEQQRVMFGIGDTQPQPEEIRDVRRAVEDVRSARTPEDLAFELKWAMGRLGGIAERVQGGEAPESMQLSMDETKALAVVREAQERATAEGWDFAAIQKSAAKEFASRFSDPEDAAFMLRGFAKKEQAAKRTADKQPQLEPIKQPSNAEPTLEPEVTTTEEPQKTTGIKNEAVARELEDMGVPLPEKDARRGFVELHAEAKETFDADPKAGARLVSDLEAKPRPTTDSEGALLTFEANRLINEREAAEKAYIDDPTDANKKRIELAREDYMRAANVLDRVGTESGRSLNARKMMLARDYSLAAIERKAMIAKGGKKLTDAEVSNLAELHKKIAATQKALDEHISQSELRQKEMEAKLLLAEAKAFEKAESLKVGFKERSAKRKATIAQSKKRIDEILNQLGAGQKAAAGLDPEKVKLTFELAKEYVRLGYTSFSQFADSVVARVGEHVRPYLQEAWNTAQKESDEELLKRYKARKESDIRRIGERKAALPLEVKRRQTPVDKDPRAVELKVEYAAAKRSLDKEIERLRLANRSKGQKALDVARDVLLAGPRALKFSFDLPPIFRQAARYAVPDIFFNPKRLASFTAKGIAAIRKKTAAKIDVELRDNKLYPLAEAGGLDLPEVEEEMNSWIAQRVPGIGASSRIYNTFMNLYRMSAFEGLMKGIPNPTLEDAKTAARAVNILTGRGNPKGKMASLVDGLGAAMSSPRLLLSNFQTLAGAPLYRGTWRVRKKIAGQYARFLAGYAALYGMVELVDAVDGDDDDVRVEWDPRSSDFGKIIVGEKRLDVLGGLSQITTLVGRVASGETKSTKGTVTAIRGEKKPYKGKDALDLGKEFLRWKLSPTFSAGVELATGEQAEHGPGGKPLPVTAESIVEGLFVPVSMEDIYDDMVRQGVESTLALRLIGLLGVGAKDYAEGK